MESDTVTDRDRERQREREREIERCRGKEEQGYLGSDAQTHSFLY